MFEKKQILFEIINNEINKYSLSEERVRLLESDKSILIMLIDQIKTKDYSGLYENSELCYSLFSSFYGIDIGKSAEFMDEFVKAIYWCYLHANNSKEIPQNDFLRYQRKINNFIPILSDALAKVEASMLIEKPRLTLEEYIELKRIRTNLRFKKNITSKQYNLLLKIFDLNNLPEKEQIEFLEVIKNFNIENHLKSQNARMDFNKKYSITDMLDIGFERINIPYLGDDSSRKSQIQNLIDSIFNLLNNWDFKDEFNIAQIFPTYDGGLRFSHDYNKTEFRFIYESLLLRYQELIYESVKEMSILENYKDKEYRDYVYAEYDKYLSIYKYIREKLDKSIEQYNIDLENSKTEPDKNKLFYACSNLGDPQSIFFAGDIKKMSQDRYSEVEDLLLRFKKDALTLNEEKRLNEAFPGVSEMRGDQIRILYSHLKNNEYLIIGVFTKKDNNDRFRYSKARNRNLDIGIEDTVIEPDIFEYLETNMHRGGRGKA